MKQEEITVLQMKYKSSGLTADEMKDNFSRHFELEKEQRQKLREIKINDNPVMRRTSSPIDLNSKKKSYY